MIEFTFERKEFIPRIDLSLFNSVFAKSFDPFPLSLFSYCAEWKVQKFKMFLLLTNI